MIAGAGAGLVGAWIVQRLASKVGGEPTRFALVGIGAGLSLSALVAAASIAIHDPRVPGVAFWFFGGLGAATWPVAGVLAVAVAVSVGGVVPFSGRLDVLSLGHQPAKHVGVNVKRVLLGVGMTLIGLGVGASVGAAGVVGFVGLLGGRFALGLVGPHHRVAIPAAAFTGALFMTGADVIGRVGGRGFEVPVGLTTTVLGGGISRLAHRTKAGPCMTSASTRVVIAGLSVTLGDQRALTDISLAVESCDFLAIVGPNGSGKSTLLRTIAGDLSPTSGSVSIDGLDVEDLEVATAARVRSYLPQSHVSNIPFDVRTVVGFGAFISDGIHGIERTGVHSHASSPG